MILKDSHISRFRTKVSCTVVIVNSPTDVLELDEDRIGFRPSCQVQGRTRDDHRAENGDGVVLGSSNRSG